MLQLLGAVEEEALFRLCDLVVDRDTAGALTFIEELSEQGQDLGRLVTDLLEHLRHLLLVQHMGEVPDSLPVTEETRERLRAQANQLGEATVLRLCDLLAVAVDDMRQGGDPRLPLELALVKVTRPAADLSRESLAYRLEQLEQRGPSGARPGARSPAPVPSRHRTAPRPELPAPGRTPPAARAGAAPGGLAAHDPAGGRAAVDPDRVGAARGAPGRARRRHADGRVPARAGVPPAARRGAEERDAARATRSTRSRAATSPSRSRWARTARRATEAEDEEPASEDEIIELMKETFDAREVDERMRAWT